MWRSSGHFTTYFQTEIIGKDDIQAFTQKLFNDKLHFLVATLKKKKQQENQPNMTFAWVSEFHIICLTVTIC